MACLIKIEAVTKRDGLKNAVIQERLGWTQDITAGIRQSVSNTVGMSFEWSTGVTNRQKTKVLAEDYSTSGMLPRPNNVLMC